MLSGIVNGAATVANVLSSLANNSTVHNQNQYCQYNTIVENLNNFANSYLFSIFLNYLVNNDNDNDNTENNNNDKKNIKNTDMIFSPQSIYIILLSLYMGLNTHQKKKLCQSKNTSRAMIKYCRNMINILGIDENNESIINEILKISENTNIINNVYFNKNTYELNKVFIDAMSIIGIQVKEIDLLFNEDLLNVNGDLYSQSVPLLESCPYSMCFWYSTIKINLRWIKPFVNYRSSDKYKIFINLNEKYTDEHFNICEDDDGLYYENTLIKLYEKYCDNPNLRVGFMLPKNLRVRNLQLVNALENINKLRRVNANIILPIFTSENNLSISKIFGNDIDIFKNSYYHNIEEQDGLINIEDIVHPNKIIFNNEGMFSSLNEQNQTKIEKNTTTTTTITITDEKNQIISTKEISDDYEQMDDQGPISVSAKVSQLEKKINHNKITEKIHLKFTNTFIWYIRDTVHGNVIYCGMYDGSKVKK